MTNTKSKQDWPKICLYLTTMIPQSTYHLKRQ